MWLGRGLTFYADEWEVVQFRPISLDSFLRPFNEHWLGVTTLVYRAMVETIGLHTYVPYLLVVALLHLLVATLAYALARRVTTPTVAAGIAIVFLFFGSGFENLFWGMQMGFLGSIALGLGAVLLLDQPHSRTTSIAAATLLLIAVATSGFGLFMLGLVGLFVLLERQRRPAIWAVLVPAGVWVVWYLAIGRSGVATHGDPFTWDRIIAVPSFVVRGLGAAFGGATGFGPALGIGVAALVAAWGAWLIFAKQRLPTLALASFGALVAMYALLGLVRSQLVEVDATQYPRYTYLSGLFSLLAIADLAGRSVELRRSGVMTTAAASAAFAVALAWNGALLITGREVFAERADLTRAFVELGLSRPLPAGVDPELTLILAPPPSKLPGILERYGSPLSDTLAGDAVRPISDGARAEALWRARHPPDWLVNASR